MNKDKPPVKIKLHARGVDFSFKIIMQILLLKQYKSKEDILRVAQSMAKMASCNNNYSKELKEAYMQAFEKLQSLSFNTMMNIKSIL